MREYPMRQIFDIFMLVAFVLFMVFLIRGFILQSAEKRRNRRR